MTISRGDPATWFVEIFLDDETLRVSNAFADINLGGDIFTGIGNRLIAPSDIERAADLKSQKFTIQFDSSKQTDNADFVGGLLDSQWRRRPVRVRYAVGLVGFDFSDPFVVIDEVGRIENLKDNIEPGYPAILDMDIESGALIFLERRNQTRSPANQKAVFAGDLFFDYAAKLDGVSLPWRTKYARTGTVKLTYDVEGVASREMLIGRGITKGSFVYAATHGEQRKYLSQVYALADHQCVSLDELYINGEDVLAGVSPLAHGTRTALTAFNSGGIRLWVTWYDGRHDQTANSYLISETAGQNLAWTSNHRGRGVCYAIIEHLWDSDLPEAFSYEFVLSGAKLYDERLDTTAGGSGSHRLDDPDTWEFSTNSEVALRHYLLGRVVEPSSSFKWFGAGADRTFLDDFSETEYRADECDALETLKAGGSQKRYETNGWLSAADDHAKNTYKLADAMVADVSDQGGRLIIRLAETQTPVVELLDEDLANDEPSDIDVNARSDDVINAVEGRYLDALNKFSAVDYPLISNATFEEIDGDAIVGSWNQEFEISEERAQRKATLYLNKQRRSTELEEVFGLKAKDVRPGDWATRKSTVRGFPDGKTFIVDKVKRAVDGTVKLLMLEVDPGEVPWDRETAAQYNFANEDHLIALAPIPVPALTVTPVTVSGNGVALPAIWVTNPDYLDFDGDEIQLELGVSNGLGGGSLGIDGKGQFTTFPGDYHIVETARGIPPGIVFAIRFRTRQGVNFSEWSAFQEFTSTGTFSALAIFNQGWGATAAQSQIDNVLNGVGANSLADTGFRSLSGYWGADAPGSGSAALVGASRTSGLRVATVTGTGVTIGDYVRLRSLVPNNCLFVTPGDTVGARALVGGVNVSAIDMRIAFRTAAGALVSTVTASIPTIISGGGEASSFYNKGIVAIAPATADVACIEVLGYASTSAPRVRMAAPTMSIIAEGQTVAPPLGLGFDAILGADPTATGIALGIAGQTALTTAQYASRRKYAAVTTSGFKNTYTERSTVTITCDGGPVELEWAAQFDKDYPLLLIGAPTTTRIYAAIYRDGTKITGDLEMAAWFFDDTETELPYSFNGNTLKYFDQPSAASHVYSLRFKCSVNSTDSGLNAAHPLTGGYFKATAYPAEANQVA